MTEPTTITETTPETSRWIGRDVYDLIAACDEALNWADANARWFDISTIPWKVGDELDYEFCSPEELPGIGRLIRYNDAGPTVTVCELFYQKIDHVISRPTHWRPIPPPPSNPPLPAPLERLGEVLRKVKGVS